MQPGHDRSGDVDLDLDRTLVRHCQEGDDTAFGVLYQRYRGRLQRFCLKRLSNEAEAEDAVQEAFARAWKALPDFAGDRRFYPWLAVIAANVCTDIQRRGRRLTPVADDALAVLAPVVPGEQEFLVDRAVERDLLARAWENLSDRHREVLELRESRNWSYRQIAAHEGVEVSAVETLIFRARRSLRHEFMQLARAEGALGVLLAPLFLLRRALRRLASLAQSTAGWMREVAPGVSAPARLLGGAAMAVTTAAIVVTSVALVGGGGHRPAEAAAAAPPGRVHMATRSDIGRPAGTHASVAHSNVKAGSGRPRVTGSAGHAGDPGGGSGNYSSASAPSRDGSTGGGALPSQAKGVATAAGTAVKSAVSGSSTLVKEASGTAERTVKKVVAIVRKAVSTVKKVVSTVNKVVGTVTTIATTKLVATVDKILQSGSPPAQQIVRTLLPLVSAAIATAAAPTVGPLPAGAVPALPAVPPLRDTGISSLLASLWAGASG